MGGEPLSHEQTLRFAEVAAGDLTRLIAAFCEDLGEAATSAREAG
jgi:hypothetical protein